MDVIANSISVLTREWKSVLGILYIFFLCSGIAYLCLRMLLRNGHTISEYITLSLAGELIPLFTTIGLIWLFDLFFRVKINLVVVLEIIIIAIGFVYIFHSANNPKPVRDHAYLPILLFLILGISVFLRLAFISKLVVPLYFDSAEHYSIIQGLIADFRASTLPTYSLLTGSYYHLGFHVLAAAVSQTLNVDAIDTMLLLGQIILALIPLPLFFLVRQATHSEWAGIFAVLFGGWAWYMPAHAVNWGKYPALLSLLSLELALCTAWLVIPILKKPRRWILIGVLVGSIVLSTFIHTRSFVLIVFAFLCHFIARLWHKASPRIRNALFYFVLVLLFVMLVVVQTNSVLNLTVDPYRGQGIWVTLLIAALVPFALQDFPRETFSCIFSIILLLGSMFVSAAKLVPYMAAQALLDRALVEMVLFLPITFLGGLGYAGLVRTLRKISFFQSTQQPWRRWIPSVLILGVFLLNFAHYNYSPNCCQLFTADDQKAIGWITQNLPSTATITISSTEARFFDSGPSGWYAGSDGGIWISPLTGRSTILLPYGTDFGSTDVLVQLCQKKIEYVYIGGTGQSINPAELSARVDWYDKVFSLSQTQVYKLIGCDFIK
jgi:hypothetical protein